MFFCNHLLANDILRLASECALNISNSLFKNRFKIFFP